MPNWSAGGSGAAKGAAMGTMIMPGWGTAVGAGVGFVAGLFKRDHDKEAKKAFESGGYVTVPKTGIPGHPEWAPGTRQWVPPGTNVFGNEAGGGGASGTPTAGGGGNGINYDAIRERGIAPSRAVYQNAIRNLNRQQSMAGGINPGYGSQLNALSRGMSASMSDAATNAEAEVAKTRLSELGLEQEAGLRGRELDIRQRESQEQSGRNKRGEIMDWVKLGAGVYTGMGSPGLK
jgi:hypothetical protein